MNKLLLAFKRQFSIFFAYLIFSSLFLFNHSGGADIGFFIIITVFAFSHVIFLTIKVLTKKKNLDLNATKLNWLDVFSILFIFTLFIMISNYYLDFIWWVTTGGKQWQHNIETSVDIENFNLK